VSLVDGDQATSSQWVKLMAGTIKINWDAAICVRKKLMGVGIVAMDSSRNVKAAMCSFLPDVTDPIVAESLGARKALEFRRDMGFSSIVLEGDVRGIV
jgi:ribonuclease HI